MIIILILTPAVWGTRAGEREEGEEETEQYTCLGEGTFCWGLGHPRGLDLVWPHLVYATLALWQSIPQL